MLKKTLLSLAIAVSTAGLTACNLSSTADSDAVASDPILAGQAGQVPSTVTPLFNPARAQLPLATDFLFGFPKNADGSPVYPEDADGTLYNAGAYTTNSDGDRVLIGVGEEGYNPVINALNEMDGVSIIAEIDIPLSGDIDAASINPTENVILLPLNYDDPITGDLVAGESPFDTEFTDFTVSRIKYATPEGEASKYALRVNLTKPLASKTRYLVIIANNGANAITDVAGKAIEMPNQFRALAGDGVLLSAALAPVRDLVQNWTALAKAYLGAKQQDTEGLVMAYTLTTGGGIEVLSTMAAPGNADPLLQQNPVLRAVVAAAFANNPGDPSAGQDEAVTTLTASPYNVPAESVAAVIGLATSLQTPGPRTVSLPGPGLNIANFVPAFSGSSATVLTGTIDLPYYLEAPAGAYTGEDPVAAGYLCTPTDVNDAVCIARQTSAGNTIISQWSADDGLLPILGASPPSTNVTRLYPFAKKNGMREVPVLVVKPSTGEPTSAGYPVIIYQHGIFGNRTNSLAVANSMASQGFVTIAIDLPLHGVMPTDLISGTTTPIFASLLGAKGTDISGMDAATQALVIGGETVAERHFGLTNVASGFSPTGVSGTDASLNGSGSLFFNLIHLQTARDNSRQAVMDLLNLNASLSSFNIDGDSDFTDIDVSQVHYIGHSLGGIIGTVFVATNNLNGTTVNANGNAALPLITETVLGMPGSAIPRLLEASAAFGPSIKGPVTTPTAEGGFGLTENSESYNQLFYVFQGALDSADPASFAQAMSLIPSAVAKYMVIESIGDQVVPNSATSPLAGTTPLAGLLGTNQIYGNSNGAALETGKYFVRFNDADSSHGSLASPGAEDVELSAFTEIVTLTTKLFMDLNPEITDSTVVSAAE